MQMTPRRKRTAISAVPGRPNPPIATLWQPLAKTGQLTLDTLLFNLNGASVPCQTAPPNALQTGLPPHT